MLPIAIDISPVIVEYQELAGRSEELSSFVLDRLVDNFMFTWEGMVNKELKSTRAEYKKAMFTERVDNNTAIVGLKPTETRLALMIEDGANPYDLKEGFARSDKRKEKPDGGWYLTIPFRFATAEALGESMSFSNKMPVEVQKVAKKVAPGAVTMQDLPNQYKRIGVNKTSGYKHKFNIYEGLHRREIKSTDNEKRGGYMNFRRVSDKSDDGAFVHPGFVAKRFMDRTINDVDIGHVVDEAINDYMTQLLG